MKKLRLLLTSKCHKSCAGCCNKDWELDELPVCRDYKGFSEIMITGGEPFLYWKVLPDIINEIQDPFDYPIPLYIYTAKFELDKIRYLYDNLRHDIYVKGFTLTLHDATDAANFYYELRRKKSQLIDIIQDWEERWDLSDTDIFSFRINVFKGVDTRFISKSFPLFWKSFIIKKDIVWIKDCPLPTEEVFMRYNW